MDYSSAYVAGHETQLFTVPHIAVIIACKNSSRDSVRRHNGLLDFAQMIDETINKLEVSSQAHERVVKYQDVCAKSKFSQGKKCQNNPILELPKAVLDAYRSEKLRFNFPLFISPTTKEPIPLPAFLGNITTDTNGNFYDASLLRLFYPLDTSNGQVLRHQKVQLWERTVIELIENNTKVILNHIKENCT